MSRYVVFLFLETKIMIFRTDRYLFRMFYVWHCLKFMSKKVLYNLFREMKLNESRIARRRTWYENIRGVAISPKADDRNRRKADTELRRVPVFVDVTVPQYNIDVTKLESAISTDFGSLRITATRSTVVCEITV